MHDALIPSGIAIEHFAVGALGCTCTIVADTIAGEAIVVDGGAEVDTIVARLDRLGVRATHLVHTHAHYDHIGALADLRDRTGGRGLLHPGDLPLYATLGAQARFFGEPPPRIVALDGDLSDGDVVVAGNVRLGVLHTPGHTPGSTCLSLALGAKTLLLTGDTLFAGSVGRTDLGGTSVAELVTSVREKLFAFADDSIVVPGHGRPTTIGIERRENPYFT